MIDQKSTGRISGTLTSRGAEQREQLEALLADTTAGAAAYRPHVARDVDVLRDLESGGFACFTMDCGYEITDDGRALVVRLAELDGHREYRVRALDDELLTAIVQSLSLKVPDLADDELRDQVLADIERGQDELDRRADEAAIAIGRHHAEVFQPTEVIEPVEPQEQTAVMPSTGTLPSLPVVEPDEAAEALLWPFWTEEAAEQLVAEVWAERGFVARVRQNLTTGRACVLTAVVTVVVTWGVFWLVTR